MKPSVLFFIGCEFGQLRSLVDAVEMDVAALEFAAASGDAAENIASKAQALSGTANAIAAAANAIHRLAESAALPVNRAMKFPDPPRSGRTPADSVAEAYAKANGP